ncbi:hypothetical protein BO83DRAFT_360517 [Aspergillus eucalypticola CBS 122712]|uniref:F-box domain-containing protein n=1 Tax=Aspergillus eucalypticola (strain CBS 122712 / IBT 29274) TaxID=1448314 RepID=A0A317VL19_ASPEC|nr:uncharacterized protein BO83DRAFT_360517 [Aspergillus eucalypticola CBS 122712]PWY74259.1 hypothetical protein BO83DRAFT_360517 [Aspergillus eucalypticola CBS 122712]
MSILSLPLEILTCICEHLEPQEWGALRITCHQIYANTLEAYATRYFKSLSLLLTRDSLDHLEEVAASEALRDWVEEIWIIPNLFEGWPRRDKENFKSLGLSMRRQRKVLRMMRGEKEDPTSTNAEAELDALFAAYEGTLAEHRAILDSELHEVLEKCLPRLKNVTMIALRSYPIEYLLLKANYRSFRCLGLRELKKFNSGDVLGHLTFASFRKDMLSTPLGLAISQLFQAIIKSNRKIRSLHTCGNYACGVNLGSLELPESRYRLLLPLLSDLTALHMCIRIKDHEQDKFEEETFKRLLNILVTVAPKLKILAFAQWNPWEELSPLYFEDLSGKIRFSQLEEIHLHSIEVTVDTLRQFLQTAAPTLKRLSMDMISLTDAIIAARDPGPITEERSSWGSSFSIEVVNEIKTLWMQSFQFLADDLELQFVQLSKLGYRGRQIKLQDDLYMERGQPDAQPDSCAQPSIDPHDIYSDPTGGQLIAFYFDAEKASIPLKQWIMQLQMEMCNPLSRAPCRLPGTSGMSFNREGIRSLIMYPPGPVPVEDPGRRLAILES